MTHFTCSIWLDYLLLITLIRKYDVAFFSYGGPVVLYIKKRSCYSLLQEQVVFVVNFVRASDIQEIARTPRSRSRTPSTQPAEAMPEMMNSFMSCPDLKIALELLQSNCSSHLHSVVRQDYDMSTSQERAAEGKPFLKTELKIWNSCYSAETGNLIMPGKKTTVCDLPFP